MKHTTLVRSVGTILLFTSLFTSRGVAERAEPVLKDNPDQPKHTNSYDTHINRDSPPSNYNGNWYGHSNPVPVGLLALRGV